MLLSLHAGRWDKDKLFCNIIIFHFRLSPETPLQKGISVSVAAIVRKCQLRVHTSRGFIYWLLGEQHCKRSGCTRDEEGGERGERTKGHKVWSEKSSTESTKIMQPYMLYVCVRGSNVPAAQNLFFIINHFQPYWEHALECDSHLKHGASAEYSSGNTVTETCAPFSYTFTPLTTFIKQQTFKPCRWSCWEGSGNWVGLFLKFKWVLQFINLVIRMIKKKSSIKNKCCSYWRLAPLADHLH